MTAKPSSPTRRNLLATSAAAGAASLLASCPGNAAEAATEQSAIRPFSFRAPRQSARHTIGRNRKGHHQ